MKLTGVDAVVCGEDAELIYYENDLTATDVITSVIKDSSGEDAGEFDCTVTYLADLSDIDDELSGTGYVVYLVLTDTETALLTPGFYKYDIKRVDSGGLVTYPVKQSVIEFVEAIS